MEPTKDELLEALKEVCPDPDSKAEKGIELKEVEYGNVK